jgi:hypothetical protein
MRMICEGYLRAKKLKFTSINKLYDIVFNADNRSKWRDKWNDFRTIGIDLESEIVTMIENYSTY